MHRNFPDMDLESVKREIEAAASRLNSSPLSTPGEPRPGRPGSGPDYIPFLRLPRLALQPEFQAGFKSEYKYSEIARYHGREFVRNAYLAILRHGPDPAGEMFYLNMLRRGRSKVEIILRLRFSGEGREHKTRIRGLIPALALEGLLSIPLLGYVLRLLGEFILLPRTIREIHLHQEMLKDHLNDLGERTQDRVNRIIRREGTRDAKDAKGEDERERT